MPHLRRTRVFGLASDSTIVLALERVLVTLNTEITFSNERASQYGCYLRGGSQLYLPSGTAVYWTSGNYRFRCFGSGSRRHGKTRKWAPRMMAALCRILALIRQWQQEQHGLGNCDPGTGVLDAVRPGGSGAEATATATITNCCYQLQPM